MKPRAEYSITIECYIPGKSLPGTPDQQWDYLMAIFRDVVEMYPGAGVTVTCAKVARLVVNGTDSAPVERLIAKSEQAHRYW